jgi:membrane-associated phospholipid phosphatase
VLVLAAFVWVLHESRWRGAALLIGSAITVGVFYSVIRWPVGRTRPVVRIAPYHFEPFAYGVDGLLHAHNLAFPSGHVCLAFASAACLAYLLPRGRWLFFGIAAALAAERVLELAHYASDVVAAAGLGVLAFTVARRAQAALVQRLGAAPHVGPTADQAVAAQGSVHG